MAEKQKVVWGVGGALLVLLLVAVFTGGGMGGVGTVLSS